MEALRKVKQVETEKEDRLRKDEEKTQSLQRELDHLTASLKSANERVHLLSTEKDTLQLTSEELKRTWELK